MSTIVDQILLSCSIKVFEFECEFSLFATVCKT